MKTVVFISRHSEAFREILGEYKSREEEQIRNEKNLLSVNGEAKAKKLSEYEELQDIDVIYSSHYARAMATAKYIAENNGIKLNVDSGFGERKFGVSSFDKLPKNFSYRQLEDWNYKTLRGESLNQVSRRMRNAFMDILKKNMGKKIMIISHATALITLFENWCGVKINYSTELVEISYKNKLIFDGNWDSPELFKLEFEDTKLVSITNVRDWM